MDESEDARHDSFDQEFAAWLKNREIDATKLTRREQAGLVTEWVCVASRIPPPPLIETLRAELAALRYVQKYREEHPWAGTCGEDDARTDRIAAIEELLLDLTAN